jgi:hypothetical protein
MSRKQWVAGSEHATLRLIVGHSTHCATPLPTSILCFPPDFSEDNGHGGSSMVLFICGTLTRGIYRKGLWIKGHELTVHVKEGEEGRQLAEMALDR